MGEARKNILQNRIFLNETKNFGKFRKTCRESKDMFRTTLRRFVNRHLVNRQLVNPIIMRQLVNSHLVNYVAQSTTSRNTSFRQMIKKIKHKIYFLKSLTWSSGKEHLPQIGAPKMLPNGSNRAFIFTTPHPLQHYLIAAS